MMLKPAFLYNAEEQALAAQIKRIRLAVLPAFEALGPAARTSALLLEGDAELAEIALALGDPALIAAHHRHLQQLHQSIML